MYERLDIQVQTNPDEDISYCSTDAPRWANDLELHLEFDEDGKLFT